jgi:hypothetical protein
VAVRCSRRAGPCFGLNPGGAARLNAAVSAPKNSGLLQAQANGSRCPAIRTVRPTTARTEQGRQCFANYRPIFGRHERPLSQHRPCRLNAFSPGAP